jgi:hypothetical protein
MKSKLFGVVVLVLIVFLVELPVAKGGIVLSYLVTDSTIGDGSAAGTIRDNGNTIGTWLVSGFSFHKLSPTASYTIDQMLPYNRDFLCRR